MIAEPTFNPSQVGGPIAEPPLSAYPPIQRMVSAIRLLAAKLGLNNYDRALMDKLLESLDEAPEPATENVESEENA